jgi:putative transposase
MPTVERYFAPGQLQFLTSSTYHRAALFTGGAERSSALHRIFVETLDQSRTEIGFLLIGWVLMPDHFHLLIKPEPAESTSRIMQKLKKRSAQLILAALTKNAHRPQGAKILAALRLPATVHTDSQFRVWQRRYYPFGIYSDKKRLEKLDSMHNNPVRQGLVSSPDQ